VLFGFVYWPAPDKRARKKLSPPAKSLLLLPSNNRAARFLRFTTSSSVRDDLPSSALGRSKGVALLFNQTPCRSGWPSGVRGGFQPLTGDRGVSLFAGVCAAAGMAIRRTRDAKRRWRMAAPFQSRVIPSGWPPEERPG